MEEPGGEASGVTGNGKAPPEVDQAAVATRGSKGEASRVKLTGKGNTESVDPTETISRQTMLSDEECKDVSCDFAADNDGNGIGSLLARAQQYQVAFLRYSVGRILIRQRTQLQPYTSSISKTRCYLLQQVVTWFLKFLSRPDQQVATQNFF